MSDSVSVFAEGTFEEQLQELIEFTARGSTDEERTLLVQSLQNTGGDEDGRRKAFEVVLQNTKGLGQGTDQEIEGFFNLLYSHLFSLWPADAPETRQYVLYLLGVIAPGSASVKYRVLSNLFNATPRTSALRLPIYTTLLRIATDNGELDMFALSKPDVQRWLQEWLISDDEKTQLLTAIINALAKVDRPESAYEYRLLLLHTLPTTSPAARGAAIDTIIAALRLPSILDFDALYNLDPIIAVRDDPLFSLFHIFFKNGFSELQTWIADNAALLETYSLDRAQLERKMRLLVFSALASDYIGRDLAYATIASALHIDTSDVEQWTIEVIRAGLVSGKLAQTTQHLHVYKSSARKFERAQWEALEKRLLAWKAGLAGVIDVVAHAQARGGSIAEAVQATSHEQGIQVESTA